MKTISKSLMVLTLVLGILGLYSCKKSLDQGDNMSGEAAFVKVVHSAPLTTALDVAFDRDRLGLNFFSYTYHTNYIGVTAGVNAFYVYKGNSLNPSVSKNLNFEAKKSYTVFIVDTASKMDAVPVQDVYRAPGSDSVRIRFANMSPDAGNLDLYQVGNAVPIATNISYKSASEFVSLKASNDVGFEVRQTGGQNDALATSANSNLLIGNTYTIWATGFKSLKSEDGKLRVERITH